MQHTWITPFSLKEAQLDLTVYSPFFFFLLTKQFHLELCLGAAL